MAQPYRFGPQTDEPAADRAALARLAWFIGLALALALTAPQPLFAAAFSTFLSIGALVLTLSAAILREPVWRAHLTRWDTAAVLYVLGTIFGWLVDRDAVREIMNMQGFSG